MHSVIYCSGPPMVSWRKDIVICIKMYDYFFTKVILDKKTVIKWLLSVSAVPQCSGHLSLVSKPCLYAHSHCYEPTIPCVSDAHEG